MQATATVDRISLAQRIRWNDLIAPWLIRLAFLGVGVLVGLYMLAPRQVKASDNYLPPAYVALPNGVLTLVDGDGLSSTLPVKIADTVAARGVGFTGVGVDALDNELLLYVLTRETTARTTYAMTDIRAPLQAAAINAQGEFVAVHDVGVGTSRVAVPEPHRWLLLARSGAFAALGIEEGVVLDTESVQKVNY